MSTEERIIEKENVVSLFHFIQELNKSKIKTVLNMNDHPHMFLLADIPDDPEHVRISYRDRVESDENNVGGALLSVTKPEFLSCPTPSTIFVEWLEAGWEDWHNKSASIRETIEKPAVSEIVEAEDNDIAFIANVGEKPTEFFSDSPDRVDAFEEWQNIRNEWVTKQEITDRVNNLFSELFSLTLELERESETLEFVAANGILLDKNNSAIYHPVLTRRVRINFDAEKNTVSIEDSDSPSEIYSIIFQQIKDINIDLLSELNSTLLQEDYHPLDRNETPGFLKIMVNQLSAEGMYVKDSIPDNWKENNRILIVDSPCYLVRKRIDGTLKAIDKIIENVKETGFVPRPIQDIVSGGTIELPDDLEEKSIEEQLAAVGGESVDILLSKEANKEQLEIANRVERYNAVLVQGPPGTGKTHTIANLMGHFLAQGKSVLVTSHTKKALGVLKEKVAPGLQNLCVSILDDSNVDMEKSIDEIISYTAKTSSHALKREMEVVANERQAIIAELANTRKKMFFLIKQECGSIAFNGESITPSEAARYVVEHADTLSFIPGNVRVGAPLPLPFEQLSTLYRSNGELSSHDEMELLCDLPNPNDIPSPSEFSNLVMVHHSATERLKRLQEEYSWRISEDFTNKTLTFYFDQSVLTIPFPDRTNVEILKEYISFGETIESWMKAAAVDGKNGGGYRQKWCVLTDQITKTSEYSDSIVSEQFGHDVLFQRPENKTNLKEAIANLREVYAQKGKVSKLQLMVNKNLKSALSEVTFDGNPLSSAGECDVVLHIIELEALRKQCAVYWNQLISVHGASEFFELDKCAPEQVAKKWLPSIEKYLNWYSVDYAQLCECLRKLSIATDRFFGITPADSDFVATEKILSCIETHIPIICDACTAVLDIARCENQWNDSRSKLCEGKRAESHVCKAVFRALMSCDPQQYATAYKLLVDIYEKYDIQKTRESLLGVLGNVAPDWANAIRNREDIHGEASIPADLERAWKWKQLSGFIEDILSQPFSELHAKSVQLSKDYRKTTALYAEKSGWYHLLKQIERDIDVKQALQGWKLTVKKIGKGTGKNAPQLKAKARELMAKCQRAVPGWIMPINRALESLNPKENWFDIVIIDEASQSDISSLAILYMGKKLIIVGDDKQVSPMAVGVDVDKLNAMKKMYIENKIPNAHLYDAKTSIYDIAATTFQPLMLQEHFRCVPEIIGFSNMLSYDFKIKPLRDANSSILLPAVVSYRAENGKRQENKTNPVEAKTVIALMKSCMEQPEYAGKTFGIISLLGVEQVKVLQSLVEKEVDPKEIVNRKILCGNSAQFQGDERNVIFLSVVDSGNENGPLNLQGYGVDDAYRKRYNVAASRARDQLWVVHSLAPESDLKPGDIRKTLLDYANNPKAIGYTIAEVEKKSESPFEQSVASSLVSRGFHIVQQWPVGGYRLDMVVFSGEKKIVIECDGERWHSGEDKVREDMERQTILERLGWRFIRIRGSEYYRNPESTMERVFHELDKCGITPEQTDAPTGNDRETELLKRVKLRAAVLLGERTESELPASDVIGDALDCSNEQLDPAGEQGWEAIRDILNPVESPSSDRGADLPVQIPPTALTAGDVIQIHVDSFHPNKPVRSIIHINQSASNQSEQEPIRENAPEEIKNHQKRNPKVLHIQKTDIIAFLNSHNVKFIDKRANNGALWIIGGHELDDVVKQARAMGVRFIFKADGGRSTKGMSGWWTK